MKALKNMLTVVASTELTGTVTQPLEAVTLLSEEDEFFQVLNDTTFTFPELAEPTENLKF